MHTARPITMKEGEDIEDDDIDGMSLLTQQRLVLHHSRISLVH